MRLYSLISIMHASSVWYPNLNKKFKTKLQTLQNKCVRFCFQLDNRAHVGITEFKKINRLPVDYRFRQCLSANMCKFFDDKCPSTRNSTMKLSQPLRRTSYSQNCISFLAPSVWNNLPNELKRCTNLNTFKHKIKEYFFCKIRQKDYDIYHSLDRKLYK